MASVNDVQHARCRRWSARSGTSPRPSTCCRTNASDGAYSPATSRATCATRNSSADSTSPAIIGAIAWLPPERISDLDGAGSCAQLIPLIPALPWAIGAALEGRRGQSANRAHHTGYPPHYYVRAIGVDPSHQGKGLGTALMTPMLERADNEHVGCFLFTATEANAAWYQSLGFDIADRYNPTPTWPDVWAMWREPR